jgi:hypothetical protein
MCFNFTGPDRILAGSLACAPGQILVKRQSYVSLVDGESVDGLATDRVDLLPVSSERRAVSGGR